MVANDTTTQGTTAWEEHLDGFLHCPDLHFGPDCVVCVCVCVCVWAAPTCLLHALDPVELN